MRFDSDDNADASQVDDRRGSGRVVGAGLGGLGAVGVVVLVMMKWLSGDKLGAVQTAGEAVLGATTAPPQQVPAGEARVTKATLGGSCQGVTAAANHGKFTACAQTQIQNFWSAQLREKYRSAKLVLFTDLTTSACGKAESAAGPFYCPADEQVYIDLGFYRDLERKLGARGGDFAEAYVLAHEYGHHVQAILGTERKVRALQAQKRGEANALSVKLELQADCYAGVWGHAAFAAGKVDAREIADALDAAAAVGDDRIQKAARGTVHPETFTHGSSADRQRWFQRGMDTGEESACDTFSAR